MIKVLDTDALLRKVSNKPYEKEAARKVIRRQCQSTRLISGESFVNL